MSISGQFLKLSVHLAFTHFLNSTHTKIFPGVLYVFWDILLFMSSFSANLLGDVRAFKKAKIPEGHIFPKGTFSGLAKSMRLHGGNFRLMMIAFITFKSSLVTLLEGL